jgi:osmotically-inducible protein OsmY
VKGIGNLIQLRPRVAPIDIRRKIEQSFRRDAEIGGGRITVETGGGVVMLKGTLRSWAEHQDTERVTRQASGISP